MEIVVDMSKYFRNIRHAVSTMAGGLKLTMRYLMEARKTRTPIGIEDNDYFRIDKGIVTLQYPHESLPVPDNARYRLHNEIDDCIVCDKCAKVCPVDCIEIDAIRSPETFGVTSDGTPRRIYAAKFDIDMSKCCFCGLCTTVCPTECLTMTKVYDFSEFEVEDHIYSFAEMSLAEIAQKRKELEEYEAKKAAEKTTTDRPETSARLKPAIKPKASVSAKPVMKPKGGGKPMMEPKIQSSGESKEGAENRAEKPEPKFKPRPMIPKKPKDDE